MLPKTDHRCMVEHARDPSDASKDNDFIQRLGVLVNAVEVNPVPTPISKFKDNYGTVLDQVRLGELQTIGRGREKFVLLSMSQVKNLVEPQEDTRTMAELFAGLPTVSGRPPLRAQWPANAAPAAGQYRLPAIAATSKRPLLEAIEALASQVRLNAM